MTSNHHLAEFRGASPLVLPSLLMCDFGNLEHEIRRLEAAGVQGFHLDVMDGHFVPNLSFGLPVVEVIRRLTDLPLDVHLMISNPEQYVSRYISAGANLLSFHAEVVEDAGALLEEIRTAGVGAGLAINPPTPVEAIETALPACDFVLVMSVMPGFGGQSFDQVALEKLRDIRSKTGDQFLLEVDGGVNESTIAACVEAGADLLVVGSAITSQSDYQASVEKLTRLAHAAV